MIPAELEYAEKRMRQKWHDLVMAEQQGSSVQVLERMYNSYILAMEEYNHCSEDCQCERQDQSISAPVKQQSAERNGGHKKKAS